uniref:Tight junction-associated protein 1 domain-containing protein n=1 Tax=Leptobrachium leishanense TaxID=445787 RepID=A0A8C5Q1N8_9ANUR
MRVRCTLCLDVSCLSLSLSLSLSLHQASLSQTWIYSVAFGSRGLVLCLGYWSRTLSRPPVPHVQIVACSALSGHVFHPLCPCVPPSLPTCSALSAHMLRPLCPHAPPSLPMCSTCSALSAHVFHPLCPHAPPSLHMCSALSAHVFHPLCPHAPPCLPTCSALSAHVFHMLCPLCPCVPPPLPTCSALSAHVFRPLCTCVPPTLPTCSALSAHMLRPVCPHAPPSLPTCSALSAHVFHPLCPHAPPLCPCVPPSLPCVPPPLPTCSALSAHVFRPLCTCVPPTLPTCSALSALCSTPSAHMLRPICPRAPPLLPTCSAPAQFSVLLRCLPPVWEGDVSHPSWLPLLSRPPFLFFRPMNLPEYYFPQIKKAEMDRKTLDWEIVELTNKLLDAKATVNKLEELNERYRQDCNLAVQLLKCNKSHFRNHKFADLPYKLQDMVSKHLESSASSPGSGQDTPPPGLSHSDVVPTSVIARVLEKPESLILNSAMSSSGSGPTAEDVFVHVDMSGAGERAMEGRQQNGGLQQQSSVDSSCEEPPTFEKLSPYPTPSPPHPMYPGRKVIEFSDEKVRIPKNSPLPNCTYATRQAISLSLVQGEEGSPNRHRTVPSSPASAGSYPQRARSADNPARSPLSSAAASSASSEEDMLASWQKMFVEKSAPRTDGSLAHRTSFSRDSALELQQRFSRSMQELSRAAQAYTERESSVRGWSSNQDTDAVATQKGNLPNEYGKEFSREEAQDLLSGAVEEEEEDPAEQHDLPEVTDQESITEDEVPESCTPQQDGLYVEKPPTGRPHRSPKRMGVHHLHRKDSLTRAQEQGNLLN